MADRVIDAILFGLVVGVIFFVGARYVLSGLFESEAKYRDMPLRKMLGSTAVLAASLALVPFVMRSLGW